MLGVGRETLWLRERWRVRVCLRERLDLGLALQLWSLSSSGSSSSSSSFGLPLGSIVEDVQAPATGGNDIGDEFGAFGADVPQRAAVSVQVGELLLH